MHMRNVVVFLSDFFYWCDSNNVTRYHVGNPRVNMFDVEAVYDNVKYVMKIEVSTNSVSIETTYGDNHIAREMTLSKEGFEDVMSRMTRDAEYLTGRASVND